MEKEKPMRIVRGGPTYTFHRRIVSLSFDCGRPAPGFCFRDARGAPGRARLVCGTAGDASRIAGGIGWGPSAPALLSRIRGGTPGFSISE